MSKKDDYQRMKAALRNILELSSDDFSLSQARYGLGMNSDSEKKSLQEEANHERDQGLQNEV